jgi:hypothetical protein
LYSNFTLILSGQSFLGHFVACMALKAGEEHHDKQVDSGKLSAVACRHNMKIKEKA